ncbi:hypothetical protein CRI94_14275 [Longibacter salinarum]|uniref:PsbP C-terminal domain-containing protein n=2 Tax=Longibacter salinarum TaxID=1850348 RepID=A0A2A8CVJ6_9BACT|nr:hypothetical protein CRI94_14275 [Longibacter salinarum]
MAQDVEEKSSPVETQLPDSPANFEWQHLPEIKGAFLLPDNWHFLKQKQGETQAYFLTREDIAKNGRFSTGLSINVIPKVEEKTGYPAAAYAKAFISVAGPETNEEVLERARLGEETMPGFGVRTRSTNDAGSPVITHRIAFGNTETGTCYLISFESPEAQWEEAWSKGELMLTKFLLDQSV